MADNGKSPDYKLLKEVLFHTPAISIKFKINHPVEIQLSELANKWLLLGRQWQDQYAYKNYQNCNLIQKEKKNVLFKMNRIRQRNWYWKALEISRMTIKIIKLKNN